MKKIIACLLAICCVAGSMPVSALVPEHLNTAGTQVYTEGINNVVWEQAEMLAALGLFVLPEDEQAYNEGFTRAEMAEILVRFMGEADNALAQKNKHPFKDVPDWASPYVGWLYQNKITNGIGGVKYGSEQRVTYWQFVTMLSRIAGGNGDFMQLPLIGTDEEYKRIDRIFEEQPGMETGFLLGDAVSLLTRLLSRINMKYVTIAELLVQKGIFTTKQLVDAGHTVYPIVYSSTGGNGLFAKIAGVRFCESELLGVTKAFDSNVTASLPYFYVYKCTDTEIILYQMDCLTLRETELWHMSLPTDITRVQRLEHYAAFDGKDYLILMCEYGISMVLLCVEDGTVSVVTESRKMETFFNLHRDRFVVRADDAFFSIAADGVQERALSPDVQLVGVDDYDTVVLYREENDVGYIEGFDLVEGAITKSYAYDLSDPYFSRPIIDYSMSLNMLRWVFHGRAGLFTGADGRFERVTDRPVRDIAQVRDGAGQAWVILSHGDGIYQYNYSIDDATGEGRYTEVVLLESGLEHGIKIHMILGLDSSLRFTTVIHYGGSEEYIVYEYLPIYNAAEGHTGIAVMDFKVNRAFIREPELEPKNQQPLPFTEHDKEWYMQQEQGRLNALGFKPW